MIRLAVILCLLPLGTLAQVSFQGGLSYGTFSMKSMKSLQNEILVDSDSLLKAVSTFPPYYGFSAGVFWARSEKASIGLALDFNSTGGRLSYGDYSGYIQVDQLLTALSIGVVGRYKLNKSTAWPLHIGLQASWAFSRLEIISEGSLFSSPPVVESQSYVSYNIGARPFVGIQRNFSGGLYAFVEAGYELQKPMNLTTSGGAETNLKAEWDGLRSIIGIGYMLHKPSYDAKQ